MVIRRIGVLSAAKIGGILAGVVGLIAGILLCLASLAGGSADMAHAAQADPGMTWITGLGAMAIVVLPIAYAVFGFIGGAIHAFIYNLAAKFVGGLVIETD
ncbi:hypothetical protein ACFOLC_02915 [Lysobacter cavernae]|uniref:DUF3566 domain-containing protein n=1 Tax=Lysobacter cavernae TaxID=1685901 RepID=A0ABV7RK11_9GAMM